MSEPIFTEENHEGKINFPLESNNNFVYDKNDVHIGNFADNIALDIKYAFKGDSRWMAYWFYPKYHHDISYIYLCVRRTGTFDGQCSLYIAEVFSPGDVTGSGPVESSLIGPNPNRVNFTITAAPGVWQIIKVDVRALYVSVLQSGGGALAYVNLDDMDMTFANRRPLFIVLEPKGTAGNTWEIALVDTPAKYQAHGTDIFPASMYHLEHWCVSPDATQTSWFMPVNIADPPLELSEGGLLSCIQFIPYMLFEPHGSGIRMRERYEIVHKFSDLVSGHCSDRAIGEYSIAQSFTPSSDITMDSFSFVGWFEGTNKSIPAGWKVEIFEDNGGDPDQVSQKIGEMPYFNSALLGLRGISWMIWVNITFEATVPITLTAGTKYWFVLVKQGSGYVYDVEPHFVYVRDPSFTAGQVYEYQESAIKDTVWVKNAQQTFVHFIINYKFPDGPILVDFPTFTPPKNVESWNRLSYLKEGSPKLYFQVSNDNGLGYGVAGPDYNDGEWIEYSADVLKGIHADQNGKDRIKLRAELNDSSDVLLQTIIYYYIYGKNPVTQYAPLLISKQMVADKNPFIHISDVSDAALQQGEMQVITTLLSAPFGSRQAIFYADMLAVPNATHAQLLRDKMLTAMCFAANAYLNSLGIGNVGVGPITSVSADGLSKSYGYSFGVLGYNKKDRVAMSFAELTSLAIKELVTMWFSLGYANWQPAISQRNEFFESDYWHTYGDQRRKSWADPSLQKPRWP